MVRDTETLIDGLVGELRPVRPMRFSGGLGWVLAGLAAAIAMVLSLSSLRPDLAAASPAPMLVVVLGLFLLLGLAASLGVVAMARPRVGTDHDGWKWAAAMTALLPLAALSALLGHADHPDMSAFVANGMDCLMVGLAAGLATFAVLTLWLRRGAPTYPEQAGLLVGIAAGSFGIFATSLHCPSNDMAHIGIWHALAVVVGALAGRTIVPSLVRW